MHGIYAESPAGGCRRRFYALSLFQRWLSAAVRRKADSGTRRRV